MELISSIGTLIAGAATAIASHFMVHDLYEGAPRHAKRLLDHAVRILPEVERERYSEEWLAHLNECTGVIEKFSHAFECLLVARKVRQIMERRTAADPHGIEFVFLSKGETIAKISMDTTTAYPVLKILEEANNLDKPVKPDAFVPTQEIKDLFAGPNVKRDRLLQMGAAIRMARGSTEPNIRVQVVDRFGREMTKNELETWLEENED